MQPKFFLDEKKTKKKKTKSMKRKMKTTYAMHKRDKKNLHAAFAYATSFFFLYFLIDYEHFCQN